MRSEVLVRILRSPRSIGKENSLHEVWFEVRTVVCLSILRGLSIDLRPSSRLHETGQRGRITI